MHCPEWDTWEWWETDNQPGFQGNKLVPSLKNWTMDTLQPCSLSYMLGKCLNLWISASLSRRWLWFLLLEFFGWDDGWTKIIQRHRVKSLNLMIPNHQERRARWVWMKEVCRLQKVYLRRSSSDGLNQTDLPPHVVKMTQASREEHKLWSQPSRDKY